MRIKDTNLRQS